MTLNKGGYPSRPKAKKHPTVSSKPIRGADASHVAGERELLGRSKVRKITAPRELVPRPLPQEVERAIAKLKSLQDGDVGVLDVIACGKQAIPALRRVLFERERSGLYQIRCRAIEALAGLKASDVLVEFLEAERMITDPVERVGEDAVINAAARALPNVHDPRVFALLLRLARHSHLTGVIRRVGRVRQGGGHPRAHCCA